MIKLPTFNTGEPQTNEFELDSRNAKAIAKALRNEMKSVVGELTAIQTRIAKAAEKQDREYVNGALDFALKRIAKAVTDLGKQGKELRTVDEFQSAATTFIKKNSTEQLITLKSLLKNEDVANELTFKMQQEFIDTMNKDLMQLIDKTNQGNIDRKNAAQEYIKQESLKDKKASRAEAREKAGLMKKYAGDDDPQGILKKLTDLLGKSGSGGFFGFISNAMATAGAMAGAAALITMLPDKVKEILGNFTAAFTTIKTLLGSNLLKPMFDLLSKIPVIGAIAKKIPILSGFLFFLENFTDIAKKFTTDGILAGIELTVQRIYKFFVGDLMEMLGGFMNTIVKKLFNSEALDFSAYAKKFNESVAQVFTDLFGVIGSLWEGDHAEADRLAAKMFFDIVDGIVNSVRALFKMDGEFDSKKWFNETVDSITKFANTYLSDEAIAGFFKDTWNNFTMVVKEGFYDAMENIGLISASIESWMKGLWWQGSNAIMSTFQSVIKGAVDIKDDIVAWVWGIWETIKNAISDAITSAVSIFGKNEDDPSRTRAEVEADKAAETPVQAAVIPQTLFRMQSLNKSEKDLADARFRNDRAHSSIMNSGNKTTNVSNRSNSVTNMSVMGGVKAGPFTPLNDMSKGR
jgi:hypothetical protein